MGNPISIVLTIVSTLYQRQQARKAAKKQREALERAREASLGQEVRPSGSAEAVPVHYGLTSTTGTRVFVDTNNSFANATPLSGAQLFPSTERLGPGATGSKNEYLMTQTVIGIGEIDSVVDVTVNDTDLDDDAFDNHIFIDVNRMPNASDPIATAFSSRRAATDTFNDLSYSTAVFRLNRDDPQFSGVPGLRFFLRGNRVYDPRVSSQSATDRSTWTYSNNAILVLLDYCTNSLYGPSWSMTDIDLPRWMAAANIADQVVQAGAAVGGKVYGSATTIDIKRYEFNGSLSTDEAHRENIETILDTIPGVQFFRNVQGQWVVVVPDTSTSLGNGPVLDNGVPIVVESMIDSNTITVARQPADPNSITDRLPLSDINRLFTVGDMITIRGDSFPIASIDTISGESRVASGLTTGSSSVQVSGGFVRLSGVPSSYPSVGTVVSPSNTAGAPTTTVEAGSTGQFLRVDDNTIFANTGVQTIYTVTGVGNPDSAGLTIMGTLPANVAADDPISILGGQSVRDIDPNDIVGSISITSPDSNDRNNKQTIRFGNASKDLLTIQRYGQKLVALCLQHILLRTTTWFLRTA